jgi:hypothetical protein
LPGSARSGVDVNGVRSNAAPRLLAAAPAPPTGKSLFTATPERGEVAADDLRLGEVDGKVAGPEHRPAATAARERLSPGEIRPCKRVDVPVEGTGHAGRQVLVRRLPIERSDLLRHGGSVERVVDRAAEPGVAEDAAARVHPEAAGGQRRGEEEALRLGRPMSSVQPVEPATRRERRRNNRKRRRLSRSRVIRLASSDEPGRLIIALAEGVDDLDERVWPLPAV